MTGHGSNLNQTTQKTPSSGIQTSVTDFMQAGAGWQTVKKRKFSSSPEAPQQGKTHVNTKSISPTNTKNRFEALVNDKKDENSNANTETGLERKDSKPPPIFIRDVTNYNAMLQDLTTTIGVNTFVAKALANNTVKINVDSADNFRKLVHGLKTRKIAYFTYQLKNERAFKIVIRHLHHSVEHDEIKSALAEKGHEVRNVSNICNPKTKEPMSLFYVDLEPKENNKTIYELKTLLNTVIRVETPRPRHEIIQCKRCQGFGHIRSYCTLPLMCVISVGDHDNHNCVKAPEDEPTCGLCGGKHTANYRGCEKFKAAQHSAKPKATFKSLTRQMVPPAEVNIDKREGRSYSAVIRNSELQQSKTIPNTPPSNNLELLLEKMLKQNEKILDLLTTLMSKILLLIK